MYKLFYHFLTTRQYYYLRIYVRGVYHDSRRLVNFTRALGTLKFFIGPITPGALFKHFRERFEVKKKNEKEKRNKKKIYTLVRLLDVYM